MLSMTGFGNATATIPAGRVGVEMRSVNARFLEVGLRLPTSLQALDPEVRNAVRARLRRGKVDIVVRFEPAAEAAGAVRINRTALALIMRDLSELSPLGHKIAPETLLSVPGMVSTPTEGELAESMRAVVLDVVGKALDALIAERRREGDGLRTAFRGHHAALAAGLAIANSARGEVVARYRDKLLARVTELLGPQAAALDPGRLEQEVVLFADKADLSEECQRLGAHLDQLATLVEKRVDDKAGDSVGRSLDFLCQEILREVNTIGSKCRDLSITRAVLDMKAETESMRENIANVE